MWFFADRGGRHQHHQMVSLTGRESAFLLLLTLLQLLVCNATYALFAPGRSSRSWRRTLA